MRFFDGRARAGLVGKTSSKRLVAQWVRDVRRCVELIRRRGLGAEALGADGDVIVRKNKRPSLAAPIVSRPVGGKIGLAKSLME